MYKNITILLIALSTSNFVYADNVDPVCNANADVEILNRGLFPSLIISHDGGTNSSSKKWVRKFDNTLSREITKLVKKSVFHSRSVDELIKKHCDKEVYDIASKNTKNLCIGVSRTDEWTIAAKNATNSCISWANKQYPQLKRVSDLFDDEYKDKVEEINEQRAYEKERRIENQRRIAKAQAKKIKKKKAKELKKELKLAKQKKAKELKIAKLKKAKESRVLLNRNKIINPPVKMTF